ncbi:OX-2 membrane glycoprotein-like [Mastacembelus armatus]|uniref:OX-2 membrane glycoprotein-like n=1 Tax=Mastacembelus armatus TaxID=205130 RepID=UPI000E461D71|nr:OX-2 membrane glycoprotein-like [Mastacembelus armatus]
MTMLPILIVSCLLLRGSSSQISGYGNTTAVYGEEASYRCAVDDPKGVLQVTWQRLFNDESIENLATYSKRFGQQVNEPYHGKVIFTEATLSSSSITLRNVTWEDESCYICSFNAYPDGSKRKQICLAVQGISKVSTAHERVSSSEHQGEDMQVVFNCSATGKPAPTIQWDLPPGVQTLQESPTTTVTNSDNTFASSRSVTLQIPAGWSGNVECVVNRGMRGQTQERIPFSSAPGFPEKKSENTPPRSVIAVAVAVPLFAACVIIVAVLKRKRSERRKMNENADIL